MSKKESEKESELIRVSKILKENLENLEISTGGVKLKGMDQIISHLYWHYKHYKNNNGDNQ